MKLEMNGKRKRGRPKITWKEVVEKDMKALGLQMMDVHDRKKWRELINEGQANLRQMPWKDTACPGSGRYAVYTAYKR